MTTKTGKIKKRRKAFVELVRILPHGNHDTADLQSQKQGPLKAWVIMSRKK